MGYCGCFTQSCALWCKQPATDSVHKLGMSVGLVLNARYNRQGPVAVSFTPDGVAAASL